MTPAPQYDSSRLLALALAALVVVSITVLLATGAVPSEYKGLVFGTYATVLAWYAKSPGQF